MNRYPVPLRKGAGSQSRPSGATCRRSSPTRTRRSVQSLGDTNAAEAEGMAEQELVRLANELEAVHGQVARCQDDYATGIFRPDEIAGKVRTLRERERGLRTRMEAVREARGQAARATGET